MKLGAFLLSCLPPSATLAAAPDFMREIRPILAKHCFKCHGPDEQTREAGLRLDTYEGATAALRQGRRAVIPGDPDRSELVRRVHLTDADVMPPPEAKLPLDDRQKALLREWIAGGAEQRPHWAFVPPGRPELPAVRRTAWPRNEIDRFVLARLEREGLAPAPEAGRHTLIKRLYLDLIGLPPSPEQADAFAADPSPQAYDRLVEELLRSRHYGERWARRWLDLARYADTNGYEKDRPRSIWPYRDWVINALNDGMPFDQFTIEQLAGDLLPGATLSQRVATGFHRNTMINEEGGIDPLEFRFHALVDRVNTTGTTWLGLTIGCAQCHTHKYDPITHTEYYQLMAYLNNADEPDLSVPSPEQARARQQQESRLALLRHGLAENFPLPEKPASVATKDSREAAKLRGQHVERRFQEWLETAHKEAVDWRVLRPTAATSTLPKLRPQPDGSILATGDQTKRDLYRVTGSNELPRITALRLEVLPDESLPAGGPGFAYYEGPKGDFFLSELTVHTSGGRPLKLDRASHTYAKIGIGSGKVGAELTIDGKGETGWSTAGGQGRRHVAVYHFAEPVGGADALEFELLFERHYPAGLGRFRFAVTADAGELKARTIPAEVETLLLREPASWSGEERQRVFGYFLEVSPELSPARKEIAEIEKSLPPFPETLVLRERPADHPRPTHRHHRGEFTQPRELVGPGLPAFLGVARPPANRLEFARWLVDGRNPLTARVVMNRHWEAFLGQGIVRTAGDFGTQAAPPTHPELLDWLATEFVRRGWSLKEMHRLIVTSATYRQAATATPEWWRRDPVNSLLARGPRIRLEAELVRDLALAASGLLTRMVGGPSVYPPQPASVTDLAYGNVKWKASEGADRYRRSLYTFSKRTAPYAAYLAFDATSGESCVARRERSNTPLQALTLLNDEVFTEAAQSLGALALAQGGRESGKAAELIFRRCLIRPPTPGERAGLTQFFDRQLARIAGGELSAKTITQQYGVKDAGADALNRQAAWTLVARAVLNLDEAITKE